MFNGQYKSINTVIENILRDTDYYNEINQSDVTEWAIRAMELIGAPLVYDEEIETITITNYRATLPDNIRELKGVRDHLSHQTLVATNDEYIMWLYNQAVDDGSGSCDAPETLNDEIKMGDKPLKLFAYRLVNGYIFTNAKEGCIDIKYTKYPLDENGCLLIPDVDRYMLAIEAYIIYKLDKKLARRGVISRHIAQESEQEWLWYVASAHSKIVTPNYDEAEGLKNQIRKMRTDTNAHDYGFKYLNLPTRKTF